VQCDFIILNKKCYDICDVFESKWEWCPEKEKGEQNEGIAAEFTQRKRLAALFSAKCMQQEPMEG